MGKIRREKRKLASLSVKPSFIKPYNKKVREHNKNVDKQRKKNKRFEYIVTGIIFLVFATILCFKLWLKG